MTKLENYREYDYFINIFEKLPEPPYLGYSNLILKKSIVIACYTSTTKNILLKHSEIFNSRKRLCKKKNYVYLKRKDKPKAYFFKK